MKVAFDITGFSDHGDGFLLCHDSKFCRVILKVQEFQAYKACKNRTTYVEEV